MEGLFGKSFDINIKKPKTESLLAKIKNEPVSVQDTAKALKSKTIGLDDRLALIKTKVLATLGKQTDNVIVIKDFASFTAYIDKAIKAGRIAIDTETNNSLDPVTCKIMGLCLYIPGEKQAYIPVNHIDNKTGERLGWQVTERQIKEQLQRIKDAGTRIVMHNGKFDYEVLHFTCNIDILPDWDTMIAARLLNENEPAGLKYQYTHYIDTTQEKYDIEELFANVEYAQVDPDIFALYSATDSLMTDKLYLRQKKIFDKKENQKLYWVFKNIEMKVLPVTASMEITGCAIDFKYAEKLDLKYKAKLKTIDDEIANDLKELDPIIEKWKLTPEANKKTRTYVSAKSKRSKEKIEQRYPEVDEDGNRYKVGKAKVEQIDSPINMSSPTQLAILFYDILNVEPVSKKTPRATGEEELTAIADKYKNLKICQALLERRGLLKLITTYIEAIPELAKHWPDHRVRAHQNQLGTNTGRYSSGGKIGFNENGKTVRLSGCNTQNIPSGSPDIRLMFKATYEKSDLTVKDNEVSLPEITEIETVDGYKFGKDLKTGDTLITDEGNKEIKSIKYVNKNYLIVL